MWLIVAKLIASENHKRISILPAVDTLSDFSGNSHYQSFPELFLHSKWHSFEIHHFENFLGLSKLAIHYLSHEIGHTW